MSKAFRTFIDILNIIIGVAVVSLTVMAFLDTDRNSFLFPIIFVLGAAANLFTAIKRAMTDRKVSAIILFVVSLILAGVAFVTYLAIGGM